MEVVSAGVDRKGATLVIGTRRAFWVDPSGVARAEFVSGDSVSTRTWRYWPGFFR
jgi:hypothetical protein